MSPTATKRVNPASSTDIWSAPVRGRRAGPPPARRPGARLGEPFPADGFEDVVDGLEIEGLDGEALVAVTKDDERRLGEPGEELGDVETGQPHVDVEERRRPPRGRGGRRRAGPMRRRASVALVAPSALRIRGSGAEQVQELFESRFFVVHSQYTQHEAGVLGGVCP